MRFTLTIDGESRHELDEILERLHKPVAPAILGYNYYSGSDNIKECGIDPLGDGEQEQSDDSERPKVNYAVELEAEATKDAKPKRGRPPKAKTEQTSESQTETADLTLEDVKSAVSKAMDSGKATGAQIRDLLSNSFGVQSFGQLKPAQYVDVLGEVENLAA